MCRSRPSEKDATRFLGSRSPHRGEVGDPPGLWRGLGFGCFADAETPEGDAAFSGAAAPVALQAKNHDAGVGFGADEMLANLPAGFAEFSGAGPLRFILPGDVKLANAPVWWVAAEADGCFECLIGWNQKVVKIPAKLLSLLGSAVAKRKAYIALVTACLRRGDPINTDPDRDPGRAPSEWEISIPRQAVEKWIVHQKISSGGEFQTAFGLPNAEGFRWQERIDRVPNVYHGAAGLGSRDVRPGDIIAAFHNMMIGGPDYFSVGIDHKTALPRKDDPDLRPPGGFSMRGHSVGGFGSVTTNKVIATIAGNVFGKDVQAYPKYGSEKKGLPTTYYLTVANTHVDMHSELEKVELLCVNDPTAMLSPLTLKGLVAGGAIFMQSQYSDPVDVWKRIPLENQHFICLLYTSDAADE